MKPVLDVVSIGSAVVDVILKSSQFTPHTLDGQILLCEVYGGKANVEDAILTSGGAGTNTAVAFARQGLRAGVIAEIGEDVCAQIIIDELEREGVDTSMLVEEVGERTGMSAVLVADGGSRSALTFRGAAGMLTPSDIPFTPLESVSRIHLSSIGNSDLIRQIFLFCREHSIKLSWNPSKSEVLDIVTTSVGDFEKCCEVVFLNELEYAAIESRSDFLHSLSTYVVVTRGKQGGEVYHQRKKISYVGKSVPIVCELGAGDAFASGFVGALFENKSLESAINRGIENGASVVSQLGAKKGLLSFK